jgi:hypothetical protein
MENVKCPLHVIILIANIVKVIDIKPTEIKCACCGEMFDINDDDKANWYENQREEFLDDGTYVAVAKIQHSVEHCGEVNLVTFHGKIVNIERRR